MSEETGIIESPEAPDVLGLGTMTDAPEAAAPPEGTDTPAETAEAPLNGERPEWLPEKFKTPEALVQSYQELERTLHSRSSAPEAYELEMPEGVELTEDDTEWLKGGKFTNEQAQHVVNYFHDEIMPAIQEARVELHQARLGAAWGMEPDSQVFAQRMESVRAWAVHNLPETVVAEMAKSANGVNALYGMMQAQRDGKLGASIVGGNVAKPSQEELAKLMSDPRYQSDDSYKDYVRKQFVAAYD